MLTRLLFLLIFFYCGLSHSALQCQELFALSAIDPLIITQNEIRQMIKYSREGAREKTVRRSYRDFFARILNQSASTHAKLSAAESLEYLSLFAQWRLLPPQSWSTSFLKIIEHQLNSWTPADYLAFALQRKLTPMEFPQSLLQNYYKKLRDNFLLLDATTQLETFSTELYHGNKWNHEELSFFIQTLTQSLQTHSGKLNIKPLKETYRSLFFLSSAERQSLTPAIHELVEQLDAKLAASGLTLSEGGTSGSKFSRSTTTDPRYVSLVMDLHMLYPRTKFAHEYSDANKIGFYDPVDLLIVEPRLIIEWDGAHHYYRQVSEDGTVYEDQAHLVLRPTDRARDRLLRDAGYRILRISPPLAKQLDFIDLPALINEQNPDSSTF